MFAGLSTEWIFGNLSIKALKKKKKNQLKQKELKIHSLHGKIISMGRLNGALHFCILKIFRPSQEP